MKILHTVESYLPARHGMSEVVRQLSEGLVERGHSVTVATSAHPARSFHELGGVRIVSFPIRGNMVRGIEGNAQEYIRFVQNEEFDIITCFAAQQWATDLLLPYLPSLNAKKVFVPTGFSALHNPDYQEYFKKMPEWLRTFDVNVFLSATYQDAVFAQQHGLTNQVLIPNGASQKEFGPKPALYLRQKLNIHPEHPLILHVGSYTGSKGHLEAMQIFLKARIKNAVLLFIGENPEQIKQGFGRRIRFINLPQNYLLYNNRVLVKALNREDTVQAYKEADVFLFPSRVECSPIVLFEAAAAGLPFLSTDVGNAREIADWTAGGEIIPTRHYKHRGFADIDQGSQLLEKLVKNKNLRDKMRVRARLAWQENFTWEQITAQYEHVYHALIKGQPISTK